MKKSKEKTLVLPYVPEVKPYQDDGFRLICPYCNNEDVVLVFFDRATDNFGIHCWNCGANTRLFSRWSWQRIDNYKYKREFYDLGIKKIEYKMLDQLEKEYKERTKNDGKRS